MFETWLLSTLLKDGVLLREALQFRLAPFRKVSPVESVGHTCASQPGCQLHEPLPKQFSLTEDNDFVCASSILHPIHVHERPMLHLQMFLPISSAICHNLAVLRLTRHMYVKRQFSCVACVAKDFPIVAS